MYEESLFQIDFRPAREQIEHFMLVIKSELLRSLQIIHSLRYLCNLYVSRDNRVDISHDEADITLIVSDPPGQCDPQDDTNLVLVLVHF